MVDKINVEIPLDLAKKFVSWQRDGSTTELEKLVREVLPVEYPDGTIAWVTGRAFKTVPLYRENGMWVRAKGGGRYVFDVDVEKVEVLTVAGDGEIVVPRPPISAEGLINAATCLRDNYYHSTGDWLVVVAEVVRNA